MIEIDPKSLKAADRFADQVKRVLPKKTIFALNQTGDMVNSILKKEAARSYKNPTRWTMNAFYVEKADDRKGKYSVRIHVKDRGGKPENLPNSYLAPTAIKEKREPKRYEKLLSAIGHLPSGWTTVPGTAGKALYDAHGNIPAAKIRAIIAAVKRSGIKTTRKQRAIQLDVFISHPGDIAKAPNGGRLPYGIWQRDGERISCILYYMPPSKYQQIFKYEETAKTWSEKLFPKFLASEIEREVQKLAQKK